MLTALNPRNTLGEILLSLCLGQMWRSMWTRLCSLLELEYDIDLRDLTGWMLWQRGQLEPLQHHPAERNHLSLPDHHYTFDWRDLALLQISSQMHIISRDNWCQHATRTQCMHSTHLLLDSMMAESCFAYNWGLFEGSSKQLLPLSSYNFWHGWASLHLPLELLLTWNSGTSTAAFLLDTYAIGR